jgi:peptidoglycan/xylan/chitin deacetylase (PgdA/CDA1 family)
MVDTGRRAALAGLAALAVAGATAARWPKAAAAKRAARAAPGRPQPPASLLGQEIRRLPVSRKAIALTFNAAWDDSGLGTVLAELRRRGLPATFFPTGAFADAHPDAVRAMGAVHGLGNHSYSHPYFDDLSGEERAEEVLRADSAIRAAAGTEPLPFFRFPYSATSEESVADVNALGFAAIEFTTDTNGYLGPVGGMTVDGAVDRAVAGFGPGAIIQMHVGSDSGDGVVLDAEALPRILDEAARSGHTVIDLRSFLPTGGQGTRASAWARPHDEA